jgi:bifunctional non-homologous end joining protein LigD
MPGRIKRSGTRSFTEERMTEYSVTLYCTENGSDKVYKAEARPSLDGWAVFFWFGPRTGILQSGTKTKSPVSKDEALKIWEKLVREKKAKGYHEGASAPAYTESDGTSQDTGLRPMLLTPAPEEDVMRFLADAEWCAQEKLNGKRILIRAKGGRVTAANRRGLECIIPQDVSSAFAATTAVVDGEMVGNHYHAFDLLEDGQEDLRHDDYILRHSRLVQRFGPSFFPAVQIVPLAYQPRQKRALFEMLKAKNAEGIVFKRVCGIGYRPGKVENLSNAHAVKVKFYASAECVVTGWNQGRQSISLGVYDSKGELVPVGSVTVPAKYALEVVESSVVQVRYLYATPAHQLYQPTLDGSSGTVIRKDKSPKECRLEQLKYEGKD